MKFAVAPALLESGEANIMGNYEIVKIDITDVVGKGTFTMREFEYEEGYDEDLENVEHLKFYDNRDSMWETDTENLATFTINFDESNNSLSPEQDRKLITDGETTLMMLPQEFANNDKAKFVIYLREKESGDTKIFEHSLTTSNWGMGQMIIYTIYSTYPPADAEIFGIDYQVCPWSKNEIVIPDFD